MSIKEKIKFFWFNKFYWYKQKLIYRTNNIIFNIKYFPLFRKLTTNLNFKAFLILLIIYILFVIIQLRLFSQLFRRPDISDLSTDYIYLHKTIKNKIDSKIKEYIIKCEDIGKKITVPFHLNRILFVQKKLDKISDSEKDIKNFFTFNHLGRLLNITPWDERYWQTIYTYTPYMKYILQEMPRKKKTIIYFYLDNPLIINRYTLKSNTYISRHKFYNMEPFQFVDDFEDTKKDYIHNFLSGKKIFPDFSIAEFRDSEVPYLLFATPIYNQLCRWIGIVGFTVDIDEIFKEILKQNREIFSSIVVNNRGFLVYSLDKSHIGEYLGDYEIIKKLLKSKNNLIILSSEEIYLKEKLNRLNWFLISKLNSSKVLFRYKKAGMPFIMLLLFLLEALVFLILLLLFNKYITSSLQRISSGIKNLLQGKPDTTVILNKSSEFKLIEERFNKLVTKISGYLVFGKTVPEEVVEEYINQNLGRITPDKKQGSVLYLKIKNLEQLQNNYKQHEFEILLNKLINDIEIIVTKHKGYIDYFSADSFLAVFGIPFNRYEHIQNSVSCAIAIFKELKRINKTTKYPVEISISINTGEIFYSQLRSNYGKFFVIIGDTIREAYYFESITKPYVMTISEKVYNNLKHKIKTARIIHLKIRDRENIIKVYVTKFKL